MVHLMSTMIDSRSLVPTIPPGEDELPYDDGEPMETARHRQQMQLLIETLSYHLSDRDDVYIGGNMFIYFSELQVKKNDFRGPDFFVVLDTVRRERKSWVVWMEDGRMPDVVIELLSESTEHVDRGEKMDIYARNLHVGEYYLYDPFSAELTGHVLDLSTRRYQRMEILEVGDLPCKQLDLRLGVREGTYEGTTAPWLRWIDMNGDVLPTRADGEKARADLAFDELDKLRAEISAYRASFGSLPEGE